MTDEINNSVSVQASTDSVQVNLDGRSAHQLSDLLSPFTELGGVLGDKIRVFRQSNAIKGIKKVKDLALELGVDIRPVPPKFLIDWVEGVSLEEDGEEDLSDLWAGLLVSRMRGGDNFSDSGYYLFKRVLREMDKSSLELIMKIAGTSDGCKFDPKNYTDTFGKFNKLPNTDLHSLNIRNRDDCENLVKRFEGQGLLITKVQVGYGQLNQISELEIELTSTRYHYISDSTPSVYLQKQGLLYVHHGTHVTLTDKKHRYSKGDKSIVDPLMQSKFDAFGNLDRICRINFCGLSSVGKDFMTACAGLPLTISNKDYFDEMFKMEKDGKQFIEDK